MVYRRQLKPKRTKQMTFDKKLSHSEIAVLSKEESYLYYQWLQEEERKAIEEERKEWTFQDWCAYERTMGNYAAARRDFFLEEEEFPKRANQRLEAGAVERFSYFWQTKSPFSQWHPSIFNAPGYMWDNEFATQLIKNGYPEVRQFSSAEQYMMYAKAMLFIDLETANAIMQTSDPRKIKELGRQVKNFEENTWYVFRWRFVFQGNKYKFTQNSDLKDDLLATTGTTLVEAAPNDKIWGIGLTEDNPKALQRSTWEGKLIGRNTD